MAELDALYWDELVDEARIAGEFEGVT